MEIDLVEQLKVLGPRVRVINLPIGNSSWLAGASWWPPAFLSSRLWGACPETLTKHHMNVSIPCWKRALPCQNKWS